MKKTIKKLASSTLTFLIGITFTFSIFSVNTYAAPILPNIELCFHLTWDLEGGSSGSMDEGYFIGSYSSVHDKILQAAGPGFSYQSINCAYLDWVNT